MWVNQIKKVGISKLLLSMIYRSKIYSNKDGINDSPMPTYYDYSWNDFNISVSPTDFRRFRFLRNIPFKSNYLSGSNIKLTDLSP